MSSSKYTTISPSLQDGEHPNIQTYKEELIMFKVKKNLGHSEIEKLLKNYELDTKLLKECKSKIKEATNDKELKSVIRYFDRNKITNSAITSYKNNTLLYKDILLASDWSITDSKLHIALEDIYTYELDYTLDKSDEDILKSCKNKPILMISHNWFKGNCKRVYKPVDNKTNLIFQTAFIVASAVTIMIMTILGLLIKFA